MSEPEFYEPKRVPQGAERRRERRLDFSQICRLTITSPPWAMTREPVVSKSEDITLNGMRVRLLKASPALIASWQDGIAKDVDLKVEVELTEVEDFPILKGQIVWIHLGEDAGDPEQRECAVGVLFSIMKQKDQLALQELIVSLS